MPKSGTAGELFQRAMKGDKRDLTGLFLYVPVQEGCPAGLVLEPTFQLGSVLRGSCVVQVLRGGNAGVPPRASMAVPAAQQQQQFQQQQQQQLTAAGPIDSTSTIQKKPKILQFLSNFFTARPSQEDLIKKKVLQGEIHPESSLPLRYDVIARCLQFIETMGMQVEGIYRISGSQTEVRALCRAFGTDFILTDSTPLHTVSGALKLYLRELNPPVIPFDLYSTFMNTQNNLNRPEDALPGIQAAVAQLPMLNRDVFEMLCKHLRSVTQFESVNKMGSQNLAIVMGPTLLRPRTESPDAMMIVTDNERKCNIMRVCIDNVDYVFSAPSTGLVAPTGAPTPARGAVPGRPAMGGAPNLMGEMQNKLNQRTNKATTMAPQPTGGPVGVSMRPPVAGVPINPMAVSSRGPPAGMAVNAAMGMQPNPMQPGQPGMPANPNSNPNPPQRLPPGVVRGMPMPALPFGGISLRKGRSETDVLALRKPAAAVNAQNYGRIPFNQSSGDEEPTRSDNAVHSDSEAMMPAGPDQYTSISHVMTMKPPEATPPARSETPKAGIQRTPSATFSVNTKPGPSQYGNLASVKAMQPTLQQQQAQQPKPVAVPNGKPAAPPPTVVESVPTSDYTTNVAVPDYQELMSAYGGGMNPELLAAMQASLGDQDPFLLQYQQMDPGQEQSPDPKSPQKLVQSIIANADSDVSASINELKQLYNSDVSSLSNTLQTDREQLIQLTVSLVKVLKRANK